MPGNSWKYGKSRNADLKLFTFKIVVLGTGMFFAIKWHCDKGK
jgi:hypothetical protein